MEGRFLLAIGWVLVLAAGTTTVHAYDDQATHPALTKEILSAYGKLYPEDALNEHEAALVMRASSEEDILPRPLNHLFDPVHGTGWSGNKAGWLPGMITRMASVIALLPGKPLASVDWIDGDATQQAYARYGGNRSWSAGMRALKAGDEQGALRSLGSALHLLQDAGVPEHARDDTHAHQVSFVTGDTGSPLENYARRYDPATLSVTIPSLRRDRVARYEKPGDYLADNARYAAASFFSKDTVDDSDFPAPKIVGEKEGIAYGRTPDGKEVPLARRVPALSVSGTTSSLRIGDAPEFATILEAQFRILAERTVLLGIGMVRDFRERQHEAREAPAAVRSIFSIAGEISRLTDKAATVIADAGSAFDGIYSWIRGDSRGQHVTVAMTEDAEPDAGENLEIRTGSGSSRSTSATKGSALGGKAEPGKAAVQASSMKCPAQGPARIRINEVAWMGTIASANDEWIELSSEEADALVLEGWELKGTDGFYIDLSGVTISARGYALLERTDDSSVPGMVAGAVYVGAMPNMPVSGQGYELFAPGCGVVDRLAIDTKWPGGDAASRRTLERASETGWQTSANPGGTPGRENSKGFSTLADTKTKTESKEKVDVDKGSQESEEPESSIDTGDVRISEVQPAGMTASDEFVELYNAEERAVSLQGWSLQYFADTESAEAQRKPLPAVSMPARSYLLIARESSTASDGYRGAVVPDVAHKSFSLSGAGAKLALARTDERLASTSDAQVADWVRYPALAANTSYERAAAKPGSCVDPRPGAEGETMGNGCGSQEWYVRERSEAQNSMSPPEPRADSGEQATSSSGSSWLVVDLPGGVDSDSTTAWRALAVWRGESSPPVEISTATQLNPEGIEAIPFEYLACSGARVVMSVILLPFNPALCRAGGELSAAFGGDLVEDGRLVVKALARLIPGEVVRIAEYAFSSGGGGQQRFTLLGQREAAVVLGGESPAAPTGLMVDSGKAPLSAIRWNAAIDRDNVDSELEYELRITSSAGIGEWERIGKALTVQRELTPGNYEIALRAVDEQENRSEIVHRSIRVLAPEPSEQFLHDVELSVGSGNVTIANDMTLRGIFLWVIPEGGPYCCAAVFATLKDAGGNIVASGRGSRRTVDGEGELLVEFAQPASLAAGRYVLEIGPDDPPKNGFRLMGAGHGEWPGGGLFLRFHKD